MALNQFEFEEFGLSFQISIEIDLDLILKKFDFISQNILLSKV